MKKQLLNGEWKMTRVSTGDEYSVRVPCDNYTQLLEAGAIDDPYYSTNERDVQWIGDENWSYEKNFRLAKKDLESKKVILSCDALDTLCEVFVNEKSVGKGENAFIRYEFDIKNFVSEGENTVKIVFDSPTEYVTRLQRKKPLPPNFNGTDGVSYIRKPACHFGWDWGPSIPLSGIMGNISVICYDSRLEDVEIRQTHHDGVVTLDIKPIVEGVATVTGKVICPDGSEIPFKGESSATIQTPELWWTRELSDKDTQPLYTVTAKLGAFEITKKIGLRTIHLDREADAFGENFCFYLNEVPIFAKGANWIIPDSLIGRSTTDVIDYYLDSALKANFNMIRIWGGAYYGDDYFYERCDELGLLLWQDFMFACLLYPFYEEGYLKNVMREVRYNVKRLKHHPSLAIWCGNNEIETMFAFMPPHLKLMQWYHKFFYEILQDTVTELDPDTSYIPTSPIGKKYRKGTAGDNWGDTHMWSVWHGQRPLHYYRKRMTRFCSEFGLESLPSMDAIKTFAEEKDWGLTNKVFHSHQKCRSGNRKMLFYLLEKFYEPIRFEDMIYCTGLIQKECVSDATEHWRRNRGRCNGSLFWQFNDCWQAPSWSSVDFTGKWKPLQYHARHFFEPICVSVEESKKDYKIFAINDTREDRAVKIVFSLMHLNGKKIRTRSVERVIPALSSVKVAQDFVSSSNLQDIFLSVKMILDGIVISERTKIFVPDRDLKLKGGTIRKKVACEDGAFKVTLSSPTFCRSVMVDIEGLRTPFSDNYFDLLPNEEKVITVEAKKAYTADDVKVKSLADVPVKKSKLRSTLYRAEFAAEPGNVANWIVYTVIQFIT